MAGFQLTPDTELETDLHRLGARELELPILLSWAKNHLASLEVELGRGVTHLEATTNRELPLDVMAKMVIEDWLKDAFRRISAIDEVLIPEGMRRVAAQKTSAPEVGAAVRRGARINRTNL